MLFLIDFGFLLHENLLIINHLIFYEKDLSLKYHWPSLKYPSSLKEENYQNYVFHIHQYLKKKYSITLLELNLHKIIQHPKESAESLLNHFALFIINLIFKNLLTW
jgi:hypothetical protein